METHPMPSPTVWKDTRPVQDHVVFRLPYPFRVLHFACQLPRMLTVWGEVDAESTVGVEMEYWVVGTGHPIPEDAVYVTTVMDGPYVWHVYESERQASGEML